MSDTKVCVICNEEKELTEFYKRKMAHGYKPRKDCKVCTKARSQKPEVQRR